MDRHLFLHFFPVGKFCFRQIPELNFYTTEQLVVLRRELGEYLMTKEDSALEQVRPVISLTLSSTFYKIIILVAILPRGLGNIGK